MRRNDKKLEEMKRNNKKYKNEKKWEINYTSISSVY